MRLWITCIYSKFLNYAILNFTTCVVCLCYYITISCICCSVAISTIWDNAQITKPGPFFLLLFEPGKEATTKPVGPCNKVDCIWHSSRNIKPSHADYKPVGLSMPAPASYSRRSFLITGRVAASALLNCTSCSTQSGHELMSDVARPSMSAMAQNSRRSCSNNRVHYYYKLDVYIRISNTEFYASTQCVN